jgi:hypothetical protein
LFPRKILATVAGTSRSVRKSVFSNCSKAYLSLAVHFFQKW